MTLHSTLSRTLLAFALLACVTVPALAAGSDNDSSKAAGSATAASNAATTDAVEAAGDAGTADQTDALAEAHEQWLAGVAKAAESYGCNPELVQQQPNETVAEAVSVYAQTAAKGSCLVLLPISTDPTSIRYSFASGGTVDGVEIFYLSDVSKVRIWQGAPVEGK
jgi:hypothetical protein